jgi:hypothetical protein
MIETGYYGPAWIPVEDEGIEVFFSFPTQTGLDRLWRQLRGQGAEGGHKKIIAATVYGVRGEAAQPVADLTENNPAFRQKVVGHFYFLWGRYVREQIEMTNLKTYATHAWDPGARSCTRCAYEEQNFGKPVNCQGCQMPELLAENVTVWKLFQILGFRLLPEVHRFAEHQDDELLMIRKVNLLFNLKRQEIPR